MAMVGYARVSTRKQKLTSQTHALREAGASRIYTETGSGKRKDRPEMIRMITELEEGDVVLVFALDRLTRCGTLDCIKIILAIQEKGADFRSVMQPILDTSTPFGPALIAIFAMAAEMEHTMMKERTQAGLAAAYAARLASGRMGGRPPALSETQRVAALEMLAAGENAAHIGRLMNVSKTTIYRVRDAAARIAPDPTEPELQPKTG